MSAPILEKEPTKKYKLPARYCRLAHCINIERVGPPAKQNHYICREEGCSWTRNPSCYETARMHAKSHSSTKKCHIFEGHLSAEELTARQREKERATNKRSRDKKRQIKAQAAKKPRTVREEELGQIDPCGCMLLNHQCACVRSLTTQGPGTGGEEGEEDDETEGEEDADDYEPGTWPQQLFQ